VAPAAASADTTFCVPNTAVAGCPAGSTGRANIANALFSVNNDVTSADDTILIGPGTYPEGGSLLTDMSGHRVDIVGAGAGQTTIQPSGSSGATTLTVAEPSSTVRDLTIGTDAGTFAEGLELSGTATRVSVAAASAATQSLGVVLDGGTLRNSTVAAHEGVGAIGGRITATRISGDFGVGTEEGTLTVDDSLITTTPGPASEEAISDVVTTSIPVATTATLKLRHDTLIGDGSSGSSGVTCAASGLNAAADCETTIDSSVIRGFQHAVERSATGSGAAASSNVSIDYTDLDPSGNVNSNLAGGTGSIALGAHDLNVNPAFAATSGPLAFKLSSPSPVIDKGDPTLGAGEPTTDLAGDPRVLTGRSGAPAVSDMGAFEYQPHPPTVTVAAVARPKRVAQFTATTSDPDPGDVVTVTWHFDDGSSATGASVSHAFSKAGTHTATAKATDLDGYSAHASVSVTVGPPILSHPNLKPRKFKARAAPSSATRTRRRRRRG
jgi:hypothetical protein